MCVCPSGIGDALLGQQSNRARYYEAPSMGTWYADPLHSVDMSRHANGTGLAVRDYHVECLVLSKHHHHHHLARVGLCPTKNSERYTFWHIGDIYTCVIFQAGSDPQGRRPTGYRHGTRSVAVPAKSVPHQSACFQRRATPSRQNTTCCQQRISVIMQCFYTNATESGGIYRRMALLVR